MHSAVSWTSDELSWSRYSVAFIMEEVQTDGENCENQGEDDEQTEEFIEELTEEIDSKEDEGKKKMRKSHKWCSVPFCITRFPRDDVSFHKFPKNPVYRNEWATVLGITKNISDSMSVCSRHFLPSDYFPSWKANAKKRLKLIAVPSTNLPKNPADKDVSPSELKKKGARALRAAKRMQRPRILSSAPVKKKKPEPADNDDSVTSEPVSQAETEVETLETSTDSADKVIPPDKNTVTTAVDHPANPANNMCTCVVRTEFSIQKDENLEIKATRILLELHEKVFELVKIDGITFQVKNIILKLGEDFYFSARRYCKSPFLLYFKNAADLHAFTGIDFGLLSSLCKAVTVRESGSARKYKIDLKERIVLCLMKIRLDLAFSSLGDLFHINESDAKIAFFETVPSLTTILRSAIYWPTTDEIAKTMPESLENFKKTITVFDCTEVHIKKVTCPQCRLSIPSRYNGDTLKILLGFAECGLITYVGKAQAGRMSNERITDENYISKILIPRADAIMTEGVLIEENCNRVFIKSLKERKNNLFCPDNIIKAKKSKNHLDHAFQRFKMCKMLQSPIPSSMAFVVDDISVIACALVNLSNPVIADKKF